MINVSPQAKELFEQIERPPGFALRLELTPEQQLNLMLGDREPGDQVVKHKGDDLLYIPSNLSTALDGASLEAVETPEGPAIAVVTPTERTDSPDRYNGSH